MSVPKNVFANLFGGLWITSMNLLFVPVYVRFLGIESYGLVGLFSTLLGVSTLLDLGLSSTLNREVARLNSQDINRHDIRDLIRTFEVIYWSIGGVLGLVVILASPLISNYWLTADTLSINTMQTTVSVMGIVIIFQWPQTVYLGALMGLERQVQLNIISAATATLRAVGAVALLKFVSPTVEMFFAWQVIASLVHTLSLLAYLYLSLPKSSRAAKFNQALLSRVWRFAAGVTGITFTVVILTQADKVILSKMLALKDFAYYSLAYLVAMSLGKFMAPVFNATYPRLANLIALKDEEGLINQYHASAQLISLLVLAPAAVITFFSYELLFLWTQDHDIAEKTFAIVSILVVGSALNGIMNIPYALQLASGWTSLTFRANIIACAILVPLIIILTDSLGVVGAAIVWVILNSGYVIFVITFMHKKLIPNEKKLWYWRDTGIPLITAFSIAAISRLLLPVTEEIYLISLTLTSVSLVTLAGTAIATPLSRRWLRQKMKLLRRHKV